MSTYPTAPIAIHGDSVQQDEIGASNKEMAEMEKSGAHPGIRQRAWGMAARLDPDVTFEEYTYWADIEREMEEVEYREYSHHTEHKGFAGGIKGYFTSDAYKKTRDQAAANGASSSPTGNGKGATLSDGESQSMTRENPTTVERYDTNMTPISPSLTHDFDAEWRTASRALRTAGWSSMFYLITTDILGWGATPNVFAQTGFSIGIGIFVLMGVAAGASGLMIWQTFVKLDSSRYPITGFGDPFHRLFGKYVRYVINTTQALQQFLTVAILIFGQSSLISQMAQAKICWIAVLIITMVVGMAMAWLRSLKHLGWLCNASVWLNVITFVIVMVCAGMFGPDATVTIQSTLLPKEWLTNTPPVKTFWGTPPALYQQNTPDPNNARLQGVNNMVYSYSGAILFNAFLSEMRRPMDFWKATILAQTFITVVYIFFGVFVYAYYGQYASSLITQNVKPIALQYVSNALSLVTGFLAICKSFLSLFLTICFANRVLTNDFSSSPVLQHRLQDRLHRGRPGGPRLPLHHHQEGPHPLDRAWPLLLDPRPHRHRLPAQLQRHRRRRRLPPLPQLHLLHPRHRLLRLPRQERRPPSWRGLRPHHQSHHSPRRRLEALLQRSQEELVHQHPRPSLRLRRSRGLWPRYVERHPLARRPPRPWRYHPDFLGMHCPRLSDTPHQICFFNDGIFII